MNIAPLNSINIKPMYFKGNDKKLPQENNPNESLQNNSPDISFPSELYAKAMINKSLESLTDIGFFERLNNFDENSLSENPEDLSELSAEVTISSIKASALGIGLPPEDLKTEIPTFIKLDFKNYIDKYADNIKKVEEQSQDFDLSDVMASFELEGLSEDEIGMISSFSSFSDEHMPDIIASMKNSLRALLTRPKEVQEALDMVSNAQNYQIYKALMYGFNGNAKTIIDTLSSNLTSSVCTDVEDNLDDTFTYSYQFFDTACKVVRNKSNLDYVGFEMSKLGEEEPLVQIEFNKDGSIKEMIISGLQDGSKVVINQDKKTNTARVRQIFDTWVSDRTFVNLDGKLKQTSCKLYVRQ